MSILNIILIAIGLAMDCLAVSITQGLSAKRWTAMALLMAVCFGLFQGGMPLIGYFAGTLFADFFSRFAPWIALALLSFIGGKMLWESLHEDADDDEGKELTLPHILVLAVATSIDALATGVIFIPCPETLWIGVAIIALASFLFSIGGTLIGILVGNRFHLNVEMIGGFILIGLGLKIWIEGVLL